MNQPPPASAHRAPSPAAVTAVIALCGATLTAVVAFGCAIALTLSGTTHAKPAVVSAVPMSFSPAPAAMPPSDDLGALERDFLACEERARSAMLARHDALRCSLTRDRLLQRHLGGRYEIFLAWWQRVHAPIPDLPPSP